MPSSAIQFFRVLSFFLLLLSLQPRESRAGEFYNALSLQGFTGIINTPNAELTKTGDISALFSSQEESIWREKVDRQENYMFSVGLFSFMELGGRLTEAPGISRDLSANIKVKVPLREGGYIPSLAFGMQDVGGGARHLQTKYMVASERLGRLRLSLGYGTGPARMEGGFGGFEFKASEWFYLVGENDTEETNLGIRLLARRIWGSPVSLNVTAKSSLGRGSENTEFGLGLQIPLGSDHHNSAPMPNLNSNAAGKQGTGDEPSGIYAPVTADPGSRQEPDETHTELLRLRARLVDEGFQNIRIGIDGNRLLLVEYENSRYNHNELDGLGLVIGAVIDTVPSGFEMLAVVIREKGIKMLKVSAPLADFRDFMHDAASLPRLAESLEVSKNVEISGVTFIDKDVNSSSLTSSLVVYPGLKTFVGTEVGVFDYLLSIKPDFYLNTWKGAVLNARWDIPVSWSENFEDESVFNGNRDSAGMDRLMLFQAVKGPADLMAIVGAGEILRDAYGTLNEMMWTPGDGQHRFGFRHAYVEDRNIDGEREVFLGSYRYYYSPAETYLKGSYGKFWTQDTGFLVELKRYFGDTSVSVYYKNAITADNEHHQSCGVMLNLPLTPRRDMKPGVVQLRGTEDWSYSQETEIVTPGGHNSVTTPIGVDPQPAFNLERVFYNRDRLSESYIRKHLLRLRDTYISYVGRQKS